MKRVEGESASFIRLKEFIRKKPAVGVIVAAAAVLMVALAAFLLLLNQSKAVVPPESSSDAATTVRKTTTRRTATKTTTATTAATGTDSADSDDPIAESRNIIKNFTSLSMTYPDAAAALKEGTINYNFISDDLRNALNSVVDFLPSQQTAKQDFGAGKIILIECNYQSSSILLSFYAPKNKSKTVAKIQLNEKEYYYACDDTAFDKIEKLLGPFTTDASQTITKEFLNAFTQKDTDAIGKFTGSSFDSGWSFPSGENITNLSYKLLSSGSDKVTYQVDFNLDTDQCAPFYKGTNHRILEISLIGVQWEVTSFIEADKYKQPSAEYEKMCMDYAEYVSHAPFEASDVGEDNILAFLFVYKKGMYTEQNPDSDQISISAEEADRYANCFFGRNHLDVSKSNYYNINTNCYMLNNEEYRNYGSSLTSESSNIHNPRITQSTSDGSGRYSVTIDFFSDTLQTENALTLRYDLEKNADGTYRFLRAVKVQPTAETAAGEG